MRRLSVTLAGAMLAAGAAASAAPARADVFGPIAMASKSPIQQAEYARDPAISGDGRYVVFDGSYGGVRGVWRRTLATGDVEQVAPGNAQLPSISDDGRYVSFTTTAALTGDDTNEAPDVYVRDMAVAGPGAFTLASAVDGSSEGLAYQAPSSAYGALASGRSAISGDGRKVVFMTTATSDLVGPRPPEAPTTPPLQVAVRELDTQRTRLVSVTAPASDPPVPVPLGEAGAVYAPAGAPPTFDMGSAYEVPRSIGASISADGTTVAWLGENIGAQAQLLAGESVKENYIEPLWRRIADGPLAPTMRVTGGSDPMSPACIASGEPALGPEPSAADPCQGPFATLRDPSFPGTGAAVTGDFVPRLSSDGYTVAFLATAPTVALGNAFGNAVDNADLYVSDMRPGHTRTDALRALTEPAGGVLTDLATTGPVVDFDISGDGSKVAFTTKRTVFALGTPAFVSEPAPLPGMLELFDANLGDETLTRVSHGFLGEASEHPHERVATGEDPYLRDGDGALSPSYASDGNMLAFASTASNLVYGDGNTPALGIETTDGSDAFTVSRTVFGTIATATYISAAPAGPALRLERRFGVTAASRRDGSVLLFVSAPGQGRLGVRAEGSVRVKVTSGTTGRARRARSVVAARTVATAATTVRAAGVTTLTLRLARRYARLARARGGFSARVTVSFAGADRRRLKAKLPVKFKRKARATRPSGLRK
jgi:hypothetical protein